MRLSALLSAARPPILADVGADPEIGGICDDSRRVNPGDLFAAVAGGRLDGHAFVQQALDRGAAALLTGRPVAAAVPVVRSDDVRRTLGQLAAAYYGRPSEELFVVGITGTNGKTTTSRLVESVFAAAGYRAGVIGTIDWHYPGKAEANPVTTPGAVALRRILAEMRDAGVTHVVMEVSSHALDQARVEGVCFDVAVFTNLTRDHLDYHPDLESYGRCKQQLFTERLQAGPKASRAVAVINSDDPFGRDLASRLTVSCLTVGTGGDKRIHPVRFRSSTDGLNAALATPVGAIELHSPLVGRYNLDNVMAAVGCGIAAGIAPEAIRRGIESLAAVTGRLERVADPAGRNIYIDYAHTPDALENALSALRPLTTGRLICVFGCGGDRDRGKRPQMGEIAGRIADFTVVTSDNPRSEPPRAIIEMILPGLRRSASADRYAVVADRAEAIAYAVAAARSGDTVLIAGKGHETYQILADRTIHFDDREAVRAALSRHPVAGGGP